LSPKETEMIDGKILIKCFFYLLDQDYQSIYSNKSTILKVVKVL